MMRFLQVFVFTILLVGAAPTAGSAHHGWSTYPVALEMEAIVTEVILKNPHDRLVVEDADGEFWELLLAPPVRNRRFGFNEDSISVGDRVRLIGERHKTKREAKIHQIWRGDVLIYEYRYNSGTTSLERKRR